MTLPGMGETIEPSTVSISEEDKSWSYSKQFITL